jgi:predicted metal-binding membrane protein
MVVHLFFALTVTIRWRLLFPTLCWSKSMVFSVMQISRMKCRAADDTQFELLFAAGCVTVWTIVSTIRCVRPVQLKNGH